MLFYEDDFDYDEFEEDDFSYEDEYSELEDEEDTDSHNYKYIFKNGHWQWIDSSIVCKSGAQQKQRIVTPRKQKYSYCKEGDRFYNFHDYKNAAACYAKSSENNNIEAQIKLGDMYLAGIGVEKDFNKAAKWYEKAASQNWEIGRKRLLSLYYRMGNYYYAIKDYVKAVEYYKKSSELNNSDAQIKLGDMYCSGIGVEKDFSKATEWYEKASGLNSDIAHKKLFDMYYQMGEEYYKEHNFEKAKEYFEKVAENDNVHAQIKLGDMYLVGVGVEQDYERACKWYEKASELGNTFAKKKLLSIKNRVKRG